MIVCLDFEEKADLVEEGKGGGQVRQVKERTKNETTKVGDVATVNVADWII